VDHEVRFPKRLDGFFEAGRFSTYHEVRLGLDQEPGAPAYQGQPFDE
jgi:hypothetical protein